MFVQFGRIQHSREWRKPAPKIQCVAVGWHNALNDEVSMNLFSLRQTCNIKCMQYVKDCKNYCVHCTYFLIVGFKAIFFQIYQYIEKYKSFYRNILACPWKLKIWKEFKTTCSTKTIILVTFHEVNYKEIIRNAFDYNSIWGAWTTTLHACIFVIKWYRASWNINA